MKHTVFLWIALTLMAVAQAAMPTAAAAQSWQPLRADLGVGGAACTQSQYGTVCLMFLCHAERGLEYQVFRDKITRNTPGTAILEIDQDLRRMMYTNKRLGARNIVSNVSWGGPKGGDAVFLKRLAAGQSVSVLMEAKFQFPTDGAQASIDRAIRACNTREYAQVKTFADLDGLIEKQRDYATNQFYLSYLHDVRNAGQDIANGSSDSSLLSTTDAICQQRCLDTAQCEVATFDRNWGSCTLHSGIGSLVPQAGTTTTIVTSRPENPRHPLIAGDPAKTMTGLRAVAGEPWQSYVARLRQASVPLGGDCQAEANEMGRVAGSFQITPPKQVGQVGTPIQIGWTADLMRQRIPAWLVISVDAPARFAGDGYFAINAGGLGPFGLGQDLDRQRAFVPLFEGGMARQGRVAIDPLEARAYNVRATLVTYLRGCQQEMPLASAEWSIDVAPGAPEIVLREFTSKNPFDRMLEVPEYGRRVLLNDTRFVLLDTTDGSEIASREGQELRLSPTKRFLISHDAGQFEIMDVVDGRRVALVNGLQLAFWNADSFYLSDEMASGRVSLGATLRPATYHERFSTVGACCANGGYSHISVSLENNMVRVQNVVNGDTEAIYSLLDGSDLGVANHAPPEKSRGFLLGKSVSQKAFEAVGTVAPLDISSAWDMPLGPYFTHGYSEINQKKNDPETAVVASLAQTRSKAIPNPGFDKHERLVALNASSATVLRGMTEDTGQTQQGFAAALSRWGITVAPVVEPQKWLDTASGHGDFDNLKASPPYLATRQQLEYDLSLRGQTADWAVHDASQGLTSYCEHFPDHPPTGAAPQSADLLRLAYRFQLPQRILWVLRARCDGGATASSIMHHTILTIYDSAATGATLGAYDVANAGRWMERPVALIDQGFKSKLFAERLMVTYAPGEGAIAVFDLTTRTFLMQLDYARKGALMEDVYVDAALQHLFQMNTDGSFTVYRLSDQAAILEGRYLDDELVVWLPDFRYDATEEGAAFVEMRFPGQPGQYSFQQFGDALRVPDLMRRVLSGAALAPTTGVPGVPPKLDTRVSVSGGQIQAFAFPDADRPLQAIRLFQDGLLTDSFAPDSNALINITAQRRKGTRWVSLIAEDDAGLVSLPSNFDLGPDPAGLVDTHFMGVGIDYYSDPELGALNYAKVDAVRLSDGMAALNGQTLRLKTNDILTDRRAGKDAILSQLKAIVAGAKEGDNLVLFFAGHGLQDAEGNFYLGLSATKLDDLPGTALDWSAITDVLDGSKLRVTVFLDACHAGAAQTAAFSTNDAAVARLTQNANGSLTILSAAKGRQFSGESASVGGGYFTTAILDVLSGKRNRYDENQNGILEVIELYRGVKEEVVAKRQALQTPWLSRNQLVGEHGLF